MDLSQNTLKISDLRKRISLELIQHEQVKVHFEESGENGQILAELFAPDCTSGSLCPRLSHNALHTGDHTRLSIFVHQGGSSYWFPLFLYWLVPMLLLSLLVVLYKSWAKQKLPAPSFKGADSNLMDNHAGQSRARVIDHKSTLQDVNDDSFIITDGGATKDGQTNKKCNSSSTSLNGYSRDNSSNLESTEEYGFHGDQNPPIGMQGTFQNISKTVVPYWIWFVTLSLTLFLCLGFLAVKMERANYHKSPETSLRVKIPKETHIRHIRSFSNDPSLKDIQLGQNGHSPFITQLQLLDLSPACRGNLSTCRVHALCNSNYNGEIVCRCNQGFYLKDMTCLPCSTSCEDGFYMTNQCTATDDVVCKPCTQCEGTSYEVATCTSTQDTLCIDVTFPIKQFLSKASNEELASLNATMSRNVFLERLRKFRKLETSFYVSNNKQEMEFVWERGTGLEIKVKVSEIYLIPEYQEVEKLDDVDYVKKSNYPIDVIDQLSEVHDHHCKRPIPDEYDLIMYTSYDVATEASEETCEPEYKCPKGVKPGDKYVRKRLQRRCKKVQNSGRILRSSGWNAVICSGNSVLANQIFRKTLKEPENLKFPSKVCQGYREECNVCLQRRACYRGSNESDCCNKGCHLQNACKNLYSPSCPEQPVECVRGDLTKFTIMPRYPSIHREFSCHLKHKPPKYLYLVTYEASIPSLQFTFDVRTKEVLYKNLTDHQDGQEQADYLLMTHKTGDSCNSETIDLRWGNDVLQQFRMSSPTQKGNSFTVNPFPDDNILDCSNLKDVADDKSKYSEEVILVGVFNRTNKKEVSHYTLHRLKESWEFDHMTPFNIRESDKSFKTSIQFERPFLYSTVTWYKDGCNKNVSKILTPQLMYHSFGLPLSKPDMTKKEEFIYQLYSKDSDPTIRFSMQENVSIMSYYKDNFKRSTLIAGTLKGTINWDRMTQTWKINITGFITECPGYFQVEILTESYTRLALYDMLVTCPRNFSIVFNVKHKNQQQSDIFIVVLNDTVTNYKMVLTSMQTPQFLSKDFSRIVSMRQSHDLPWLPIIAILVISSLVSVLLVILYVYCDRLKSKRIPIDINLPKPDLGAQITLLHNMDRPEKPDNFSIQTRFICSALAILYIAYAILFTFSALFGMLHIIQGSSFSQITLLSNTSAKIQNQMQSRLKVMVTYENQESERMLRAAEQRLKACSYHLKSTMSDSLPDINIEVEKEIRKMFGDVGMVRKMFGQYFARQQASYQTEIQKFVKEFNETIDRTLTNRLLVEYTQYLRNVAKSRWLKFPQEVFVEQQRREGKYISDVQDNLMEFLSWIEIEKVKDVLEIKQLLMERLLNRMPVIDFAEFLDNSDSQVITKNFNLTFDGNKRWLKFTTGLPPGYHSYSFNNRHSNHFLNRNQTPDKGSDIIGKIRAMLYPLFISAFLILDIFLLTYRISWMMQCVRRFKTGIEQRVPYDSITRRIHFILTGIHVPRTEDSLDHPYDYYMNNKDNIWADDRQLYFLYCQSSAEKKEEILKEIFANKQRTMNPEDTKPKKLTWFKRLKRVLEYTYRVFIAPVFWRCVLICGFVLVLCLVTKATDDLVTMESASFLLDTESMTPILSRQNEMTNNVLQQYGDYLNDFLIKYKTILDSETNSLNSMLVHVAEKQSTLLNTLISDMCNLAGLAECDNSVSLVTTSITSCNFLPIKPKLYMGQQEDVLSEFVKTELSPIVTNFRNILLSTWYLLLGFSAAMLICQIAARVVFVHLKKSTHLRTTKIYQLPSTYEWQEHQSFRDKDVYASQSVIAESCESGVYDMTS